MQQALHQAGFTVDLAHDYIHLENLWQQHRHEIVLLEVAYPHSVDPAVHTALRLKQQDSRQFIAYLADPSLSNSGLAGDAVFPRDARHLPEALRQHLEALPR
jgi:DNA-binding response OmpR family regulator